ncbi:MAG TPA: response regulator, partial [Polyangiaceae bacterium]
DRLRRDLATQAIPVHFLSASDASERGLALGAVGYLTKPATRDELMGVLQVLSPAPIARYGRVLVVEDDRAAGEAVAELLRHEGIGTVLVASAGAALAALGRDRYGCIILDLGLPDMDGLELLEKLQRSQDGDRPPIIVHTGRALTKRETRRIEAYAEAVVLKDGSSNSRLLDEIRLFIRYVEDTRPNHSISTELAASEVSLVGTQILLADDDMRTVYALSALLRSRGADVLVADTGHEALEQLAEHPDVQLVLMDVMMPEMDGYEAMRQIRQQSRYETLPVIALTAKAMKGERERCVHAGASDYLSKPVDGPRLLAALQPWLKSRQAHDT